MKSTRHSVKTLAVFVVISASLNSCGESVKTLDILQSEKSSLTSQLNELKTQISTLDEEIALKDTSTKEENLPIVSVIEAEEKVFEHYFEIQGSVEAARNAILLPESGGGIIKSLEVQEGQTIAKGKTVATFDSDVIASNMKELQEQLDLAKYMYDKQKSLYDQGVGTEVALKQAEGQYQSLEKTMNTLRTQKGKFVLTAPFSGYVEEVFPVVGEMAGPASPIIRLINLDKVSVKANVSEAYLSKINESSKVDLFFPALDSKKEGLTIKRVGKFINPVNRTVVVEVEIPQADNHYVPNLMAVLQIRDYIDTNAIVVPSNVIMESSKGKPFVKVLASGNKVEIRDIEVGKNYKGNTQILSGLTKGDLVIADGKGSVVVGQEVERSN